ncbi:MAG: chromosome partitioning protein ParA, partial [Bacteroidales bacterium]|nr:chromosome partitioning protein ParA [Bacteroidales bacterium]
MEKSINLVDLFRYLLSYWYLFLLCLIVFSGVALYKYAKTQFVYRSTMNIRIKDPSKAQASVRMDAFNQLINRVNLSNEILQFRSKKLMADVVRRLDADVNYGRMDMLRWTELYTSSPVKVVFPRKNINTSSGTLRVTPVDVDNVRVYLGTLGG